MIFDICPVFRFFTYFAALNMYTARLVELGNTHAIRTQTFLKN